MNLRRTLCGVLSIVGVSMQSGQVSAEWFRSSCSSPEREIARDYYYEPAREYVVRETPRYIERDIVLVRTPVTTREVLFVDDARTRDMGTRDCGGTSEQIELLKEEIRDLREATRDIRSRGFDDKSRRRSLTSRRDALNERKREIERELSEISAELDPQPSGGDAGTDAP